MEFERIDVAGLDRVLAGRLAAIHNAALDGVPLPHHTAETFLLECRDHEGEGPLVAMWVARDRGQTVAYAGLHHNAFANLDGAKVLGAVHPDHRRRGIGRILMAGAEAATDRRRLRAPAWARTAGELAIPALGYTRAASHEVRRLSLRREQPTALVAEANAAAADYDLERFSGPCPDDLLPDMQRLREAINDAPEDGEFEAYPPARIRRYEEWLAGLHQTGYNIVARHRATGEPAGLTIVCTDELRPAIAAQEDTSVLAGHRGHRLGLRLKLDMIDWLRAERPDVEATDTWNVPHNRPMVAINDALGCEVVAKRISFRKDRGSGATVDGSSD